MTTCRWTMMVMVRPCISGFPDCDLLMYWIDTDLAYSSNWTKSFIEPLMKEKNLTKNTLFVLTWDENDTWTIPNQVYAVLFGPAVKRSVKTDDTAYNHYSVLRSVEENVSITRNKRRVVKFYSLMVISGTLATLVSMTLTIPPSASRTTAKQLHMYYHYLIAGYNKCTCIFIS